MASRLVERAAQRAGCASNNQVGTPRHARQPGGCRYVGQTDPGAPARLVGYVRRGGERRSRCRFSAAWSHLFGNSLHHDVQPNLIKWSS